MQTKNHAVTGSLEVQNAEEQGYKNNLIGLLKTCHIINTSKTFLKLVTFGDECFKKLLFKTNKQTLYPNLSWLYGSSYNNSLDLGNNFSRSRFVEVNYCSYSRNAVVLV